MPKNNLFNNRKHGTKAICKFLKMRNFQETWLYNQIDGVAMGASLAPVLANIFMGFHESKWLQVDDILAAFGIFKIFKILCPLFFYQIFIFSQNDNPLQTIKNVFYFI